jgi:predicted membrane protein
MKKLLLVIVTMMPLLACAQEFKVSKNTGRLEIHLGRVTVEGHNGNEIIFTSSNFRDKKDERAEGLRAINGLGLDDNTGLGINVTETGNTVVVHQLKRTSTPDIKILVPKGLIVAFEFQSQYGGKVKFLNMENEIEVSAQYNSVEMENITGPMVVKSVYGHVEALFNTAIKSPVSIVSVYGYVDMTIPTATKANIRMDSSYGEIFVSPQLKIDVDRQGDMIRYSDKVQGKLNGGGDLQIDLSSNYGKIYLRNK